ncbi:hypothetical protein DS2_17190 [Catenovulum agarivorans DS-2]|uniref:Polysaccharide lyase 14 domain-containing protein n=2 Tax=Catenovulum agarivorans TaxID=1172192 RepID=W7Q6T9_9ALTE|nr:hypothetical protein DS2_17190 [Catenovulum agarivorans DS-2]
MHMIGPKRQSVNNYYCDEKIQIGDITDEISKCLLDSENIVPITVNGKLGYKVGVVPTNYGSERVIKVIDLQNDYVDLELSFDLSFGEKFDFAQGGKLLGLSPQNILSGGVTRGQRTSKGWSVRAVFGKSGALGAYYYLPRDSSTYGNFFFLKNVRLNVGDLYNVSLRVLVNSEKQGGKICLSAGKYTEDGLQLLGKDCKDNLIFSNDMHFPDNISRLLFTYFHGGHSISYKPNSVSHLYFYNLSLVTRELK